MYKNRKSGKSVQFAELARRPHLDNKNSQYASQFLFVYSGLHTPQNYSQPNM